MKKLSFLFFVIILSTSVLAYYSQNGTWEARTRIDSVGGQATNGTWTAEDYTGGMHPVTANFTAPYTGYIGAFDLTAQPSLIVTKTDNPDPVISGTLLNYTITISNVGTANATNTIAIETYPAGVTFINSSPSPSVSNNTWNLSQINAGQNVTINITVNVTIAGLANITNFINVSYQNSTGATLYASDTETTLVIPPDRPFISITKADTPDPVNKNGQINYTITLINNGGQNATNVTANETYPSGVVFDSASPLPTVGDNFWDLGNMTTGQNLTINITVNVTATSGNLVNLITIEYRNSTGALFSGTRTATTRIRPSRPPGGGGGGGAAGKAFSMIGQGATYSVKQDVEQIEVEYGDTISYIKDGIEHLVYVNAITRNGIQLVVDSEMEYNIPLHGEALFDLDADKTADLRMLVNEIYTNKALLSVFRLYALVGSAFSKIGMTEPVQITENVVKKDTETENKADEEEPSTKISKIKRLIPIKYAYLIPFALVAIILIALIATRRKRAPHFKHDSQVEDINAKIERLNETLNKYKK
jgi:uncharacterized repeat protein (TIGR01451 family)